MKRFPWPLLVALVAAGFAALSCSRRELANSGSVHGGAGGAASGGAGGSIAAGGSGQDRGGSSGAAGQSGSTGIAGTTGVGGTAGEAGGGRGGINPNDAGLTDAADGGNVCAQFVAAYASAIPAALACTPGAASQCQHLAEPALITSCPGCRLQVYLNDPTRLDAIRAQWAAAGCLLPIACPNNVCALPRPMPATCVANDSGDSSTGTCVVVSDAMTADTAQCFPIFHACTSTEECCAPNRCLAITGTLQCQQEGPAVDGGP